MRLHALFVLGSLVLACSSSGSDKDAATPDAAVMDVAAVDAAVVDVAVEQGSPDAGDASDSPDLAPTAALTAALVVRPKAALLQALPGEDSASVTLTFVNSGGWTTGLLKAAIEGADAGSFRIVTNTCTSLEVRSFCTISVIFHSETSGSKTATLMLTDSTNPKVTASASLTGETYHSDPLRITGSPDLGTVKVGQTGAPVVFTVICAGDTRLGPIRVSWTAETGSSEFIIVDNQCAGPELCPAGTCTVSVALKPTSPGAKAALLVLKSPSLSSSPAVTLTGTAVAP